MHPIRHRYSPLPSPPPDKSLYSSDLSRFALKLGSSRSQEPPVVASFPSPPMSGSPPPPTPPENSRTSGLSRKRSLSPPSSAVQSYQPTTSVSRDPYVSPARPGEIRPFTAASFSPILPGLPAAYPAPVSYPPPPSYHAGYGPGYLGAQPQGPGLYPPGPTLPSQHETPAARAARKPKAHVASACVNCKKKHLRCDNARPCRRCTQSGKEDTCVDVTHKKRGRPPLKADENPPRRPYETSLGSLTTPTVHLPPRAPPSSQPYYGQSGVLPTPRGLAPLTSPGSGDERSRPPPLFSFPAPPQPSSGVQVQPTHGTPVAQPGHRHFSSESSSSSNRPLSPYFSSPLHSPLGPTPTRTDTYGRQYPTPASGYSGLPPSNIGPPRPYQSITSIASSNAPPVPAQQPQPYQQLLPPEPPVQLPPLQHTHHQQQQPPQPQPPPAPRAEWPASSAPSIFPAHAGLLQTPNPQPEDTAGPEAKRQRMDLGGMLRRTTEP